MSIDKRISAMEDSFESRPYSGEIEFIPPKIRKYTEEEQALFETGSRREQIIARATADIDRYREAWVTNPNHRPHFERLIRVGGQAIEGWNKYFDENEIENATVVSFDGTEGPAYAVVPSRVPSGDRANIPA